MATESHLSIIVHTSKTGLSFLTRFTSAEKERESVLRNGKTSRGSSLFRLGMLKVCKSKRNMDVSTHFNCCQALFADLFSLNFVEQFTQPRAGLV
jgi:hypothetical protein